MKKHLYLRKCCLPAAQSSKPICLDALPPTSCSGRERVLLVNSKVKYEHGGQCRARYHP